MVNTSTALIFMGKTGSMIPHEHNHYSTYVALYVFEKF